MQLGRSTGRRHLRGEGQDHARNGDECSLRCPGELAEQHLDLVDEVVEQLRSGFPRHVDADDLRGAGALGLVDAAHRYDSTSPVPFERYAAIRIRGAILDDARTRDWAPRRLRRDLRAIRSASDELEAQLQRQPHQSEVADLLRVEEEVVDRCRAQATTAELLTLDRSLGPDGSPTEGLAGLVPEDDPQWLPSESAEQVELLETLRRAVWRLPSALRKPLVEHEFEGRLLREVAADLGLTEARASQLRQEGIHALRSYFATVYDNVPPVPAEAPGKRRRRDFVRECTQPPDAGDSRPGALAGHAG